jgi:hypothetical protein
MTHFCGFFKLKKSKDRGMFSEHSREARLVLGAKPRSCANLSISHPKKRDFSKRKEKEENKEHHHRDHKDPRAKK